MSFARCPDCGWDLMEAEVRRGVCDDCLEQHECWRCGRGLTPASTAEGEDAWTCTACAQPIDASAGGEEEEIKMTSNDPAEDSARPSSEGNRREVLDGPAAVVRRLVMTLELLDELLCSERYDEATACVQATLVGTADPEHVRERLEELRGGQAPRAPGATAGGEEA